MGLRWTRELETGIRKIDLQHQELIEIINAFESAHQAGEDERAMSELLPRLAGYLIFHFATEESMFRGFPGSAEHKALHAAQHKEFKERFGSLKDTPAREQRRETSAMLDYLKQWLRDHIMKTDMQLARLILLQDAKRG